MLMLWISFFIFLIFALNLFISVTLLLSALPQQCVGTVKNQDTWRVNAPMIQYAICVVRWVTWRVIALTQACQLMIQGSVITATRQATLLFTVPMRKLATTAAKLVTLPVIVVTNLYATCATYRGMWLANVPRAVCQNQNCLEGLSVTLFAILVGILVTYPATVCL